MNSYTTTTYNRQNRRAVSDLLFYSHHIQTHLDWHDAEGWINTDEAVTHLAWKDALLTGILSVSPPLNGATWVRVLGVGDASPVVEVVPALWHSLNTILKQQQVSAINWLLTEDWQNDLMSKLGFSYQDQIITLQREGYDLPNHVHLPGLRLRPATRTDAEIMEQVDHAAFAPPWQNSTQDITHGLHVAATSTIAEYEGEVVGFQMSTLYQKHGHLARLAVHPKMQGKGVGRSLLSELITYFLRRRVRTITVNTQASNTRSRHLYERFGFRRNYYDMPVWIAYL
jgi:ribosomal protein S18 acetylase RimI-like enzyme